MRLNLTNVKSTEFEPLPNGAYLCAITDCESRTSENSGNTYLNWTLNVQEGEFKDRKLWAMTALTEQSLWRLVQLIEAATGEKLPQAEIDLEPKELFGKRVVAIVSQENYEGVLRNRVTRFKPAAEYKIKNKTKSGL